MRKIISLLLILVLVFSVAGPACAQKNIEIHVSVKGSDITGNGSIEKPYATFEKAKAAVNTLRKETKVNAPVDVIFHEGTYRFTKSVDFTDADSGTALSPTTYKGAEGENVVFKGSVELDLTKINLVQDMDILNRLPLEARGQVGYFNLREMGIYEIQPMRFFNQYTAPNYIGYVDLFFNGMQQPIAQWPNGQNVYSAYEKTVNAGGSGEKGVGGTIKLKDYRLKKWVTAPDMVVDIFGGNDYAMDANLGVSSINAEEKTMTFKTGTDQGLNSAKSKRFKVKNLIEELDRPGEWYIDREKLILYYYPEQSFVDGCLELSLMEDNLFELNNLKYTNFENLTFSQVRGVVFRGYDRWENITIDNCRFENIGSYGLWHFSNATASIGQNTTQGSQFRENGCLNLTIRNCSFDTIARPAISIRQAGSFNRIEPGNCIIENNYFTNTLTTSGAGYSVYYEGIEGDVRNNLFHNVHSAINFLGIDNEINNNEIYNIQRYVSDAGAIYTGRNYLMRDNYVYNNFVRDVSNKDPHMNTNHNRFVYLDDAHAGITVHNNIFIGNASGGVAVNGGQDNHVYDNILVNVGHALMINSWTAGYADRIAREQSMGNDALKNESWSRFHDRIRLGLSEKYLGQPSLNTVYNNIMINGEAEVSKENVEMSDVHDNIIVTEDVFEDFENGDFRIKDEEIIKKFPNTVTKENFNYDDIGLDIDKFIVNPIVKNEFKLLYPKNGAVGIDNKEITFTWQRAKAADRYRFVLATDPELKNRIIDETVYETAYTTDVITDNNTSYYWKVYAYNDSLRYFGEWESKGVAYNFVTTKEFSLETDTLDTLIMAGKKLLEDVVEGDEVGQYIRGFRANVEEKIAFAEEVVSGKRRMSVSAGSALIKELDDLINNQVYVKGGYFNVQTMLENPDRWIVNDAAKHRVNVEDGKIKVTADELNNMALFGYEGLSAASKKIVVCFKLKVDFGPGTGSDWLAFGMRARTAEQLFTGGNNNYFILLKKGLLEYQKNSGGVNKLITSVDNEKIVDNEWMEIQFGVIDLNDIGVLTICKINGEIAYQAIDTENDRVMDKGTFNFNITHKLDVEIAPSETTEFDDIDKLIADYTLSMTEDSCKKIEEIVGNDTTILQMNSTKAFTNHQLTDISQPVIFQGESAVIPVETAKSVLGAQITLNGNKINVNYNNHNLVFENGSSVYTVDGASENLGFVVENNNLPLRALVTGSGMSLFYYNRGMIMIMENSLMNYANYDSLLDAASRSLDFYR